MKALKLSIKPRREPSEGQLLNSSGYSIKINDWELGRGVTDFKLEMSASKKPKATITFTPSVIDVNEMMAVLELQTSRLNSMDRPLKSVSSKKVPMERQFH